MDMVDEDLVRHKAAAREEELQRFLEKHGAARATKEQLEKIFDAGWDEGLSEEDQKRVIDLIQDPYCLYPLEYPTLLESALEMVKSMVVVGREAWKKDVQDETEEPKEMEEQNVAPRQLVHRGGPRNRGGLTNRGALVHRRRGYYHEPRLW